MVPNKSKGWEISNQQLCLYDVIHLMFALRTYIIHKQFVTITTFRALKLCQLRCIAAISQQPSQFPAYSLLLSFYEFYGIYLNYWNNENSDITGVL